MEKVFDYARVKKWRESDNPARLSGVLEFVLPKHTDEVQHFATMPYSELPQFMHELQARPALSARMLEFAILTASRTNEVRLAQWPEVDLDQALWTIQLQE